MSYATVDDVVREYDGTISAERRSWVENKLSSAEILIRGSIGSIEDRITAGRTTADNVRLVLCNMVIRALDNPKGFQSQSAGPYTITYGRGVQSGVLYLSNEDKRALGIRRAATLTLDDPSLPYVIRRDCDVLDPWRDDYCSP